MGYFYYHGLFCASHPAATLSFTMCIALLCCSPLLYYPPPGSAPVEFMTSHDEYDTIINTKNQHLTKDVLHPTFPIWFQKDSGIFVQQFLVKAIVSPWNWQLLIPSDAYKATLAEAFDIIEHLRDFNIENSDKTAKTINDLCFKVGGVNNILLQTLLPTHDCVLLSPTSMWLNKRGFLDDPSFIKSIYYIPNGYTDTTVPLKDILFGLSWKDTGIKRYFIRNKQRPVSFAVTLVYNSYDPQFIAAQTAYLLDKYNVSFREESSDTSILHVYFKPEVTWSELTPFIVIYSILFLYVYFSVRKIEMVKSKSGLAFAAVMQITLSLCMSLGICSFIGLRSALRSSEIFPYLAVVIGFENILVLTKSVVHTPPTKDVKLRIAEGLSKEGVTITKYFLTELFLSILGFFTFISQVQEFCSFAAVALCCDFFLQTMFFIPVLSIDIRRLELDDLISQGAAVPSAAPGVTDCESNRTVTQPRKPNPHPRHRRCPVLSTEGGSRRLKIFFYLASSRFVHRLAIGVSALWIAVFLYSYSVGGGLTDTPSSEPSNATPNEPHLDFPTQADYWWITGDSEDLNSSDWFTSQPTNRQLLHSSHHLHWPTLFSLYNISLAGTYISFLPTRHLSLSVSPRSALAARSSDEDRISQQRDLFRGKLLPRDRSMLWDIPLVTGVSFLCGAVLIALLSLLYRCLGARDTGKAVWPGRYDPLESRGDPAFRSSVSRLVGHRSHVDLVASDGPRAVSVGLDGEMLVWDLRQGSDTPLCRIDRQVNAARDVVLRSVRKLSDSDKLKLGEKLRLRKLERNRLDVSRGRTEDLGVRSEALTAFRSPVWCVAVSRELVFSGTMLGHVEIWDVTNGGLVGVYKGPVGGGGGGSDGGMGVTVMRARRVHCGTRLVVGRVNGIVEHVDVDEAMEVSVVDQTTPHDASVVALELLDRYTVTGSRDSSLAVIDPSPSNGERRHFVRMVGHSGKVTALAVDRDKSMAVSGSATGEVWVWSVPSGLCVRRLAGHRGPTRSVVCYGSWVASLGDDKRLYIYDIITGIKIGAMDVEVVSSLGILLGNMLAIPGLDGVYLRESPRTDSTDSATYFISHPWQPPYSTILYQSNRVITSLNTDLYVLKFSDFEDK